MRRDVVFLFVCLLRISVRAQEQNTCETLQGIANMTTTAECTTNGVTDCDTIMCTTSIPSSDGQLIPIIYEIIILPCINPAGIRFVVLSTDQRLLNQTFVRDSKVTLAVGVDVEVIVNQLENNIIGIELTLIATANGDVTILPYTPISPQCEGKIQDQTTTCQALQEIASMTTTAECTTNGATDCDTIMCTTSIPSSSSDGQPIPITYEIIILPCINPAGIRFVVLSTDQRLLNQTFVRDSKVTLAVGVDVEVTINQLDNNVIGIELTLMAQAYGDVTILPYTQISVQCEGMIQDRTTCQALHEIASTATTAECTTNGTIDCDTIMCTASISLDNQLIPITYEIVILPCNTPVGIGIRFLLISGDQTLLNQTFTGDSTVTLAFGIEVKVTVTELSGAVGLELTLVAPEMGDVTILPYTQVPIPCGSGSAELKPQLLTVALLSLVLAMLQ